MPAEKINWGVLIANGYSMKKKSNTPANAARLDRLCKAFAELSPEHQKTLLVVCLDPDAMERLRKLNALVDKCENLTFGLNERAGRIDRAD